jgi:predicted PurR-regulated permease PerM
MALLALGVILKVMAGVFTQITIALFAMFLVEPAVARATAMIDGILQKLSPARRRRKPSDRKKSHLAEFMGSLIVILLALALVAFVILILYAAGNMLLDRKDDLVSNVVEPVVLFINGVQHQWLPELYRSVGMEETVQPVPTGRITVKPSPADSQSTSPMAVFDDAIDSISITSLVPTAANLLGSLSALLFKVAIVTMLTVFMLSGRRLFSEKLTELNIVEQEKIERVLARVEGVPRRYLVAKLFASLLTGILVGSVLLLWLEPGDAFIWGFIAMVMDFIPFFGSLISVTLIALYTLSVAGMRGLWAVPAVIVLNNIVSNVIEPNYFGRVLPIGKLTVLICVLFWGFLWGLTGVLLAVPITIMLKEFIEQVFGRNAFTVAMEV